jgi:hypothetical protein
MVARGRPHAVGPKRVALIALPIFAVILAAVATLCGTSILVLRTNWGGECLRRLAVSQVNKQIQGSLDIKRLSFRGDKVVVWGVAVRDPDQQLVAQVARVEVDFALMRILHKEVRLTAFVIETPLLTFVSDASGLNLSRAIAPRKKPAPKQPASPKTTQEGWVMRIDSFDLAKGDLTLTVASASSRETKVHLAGLRAFANVRYATGNGSLDLTLRLDGQSQLVPTGPLRLACGATIRGESYRFDADGDLLGGTLKAHGNVDGHHLENADGLIALALPRQGLAGHDWGPLRIAAEAHPSSVPKLDVLLAIPGLALAVKDRGLPTFSVEGSVTMTDLGLTAKAAHALTGMTLPPLGGRGELTFGLGGPPAGAQTGTQPAGFGGRAKGSFDSLSFGENVINRIQVLAGTARLSSRPGSADLQLSIASVSAGTTHLRGIALAAKVHEQDVSATFGIEAPARVDASLAGRLDDDRHGLALGSLVVSFPGGSWASDGTAWLRFDDTLSASKLRLVSDGQVLTIDGSKRADDIAAHLALSKLRLDRLPTILIDPALHVDGELDADIKADGQLGAPNIVARLELRQARYQNFSKIDAQVAATLRDQTLDGTAGVEAPFLKANAEFKVPVDLTAPGTPIALRLDVKHLDIGQVLRGAEMPASGDGRLNLKLRLDGSADKPNIDLTLEAFDLAIKRPGKGASNAAKSVDLGHARVHLTYANRAARAEVDFASSNGGTLVVDAGTHVDMSYPRVTRGGLVVPNLPIHGKVVARNLDVSWVAQLNPRVVSMGGQVNADARLGGTVGDPQFIGDVHWKNGEVVATPSSPDRGLPAVQPARVLPSSAR